MPSTPKDENRRSYKAGWSRDKRKAGVIVHVPALSPADRAERLRREADDELWLRSYWSAFSLDSFYSLSPQQRQMMADFREALESGGDRAVAASRGEGKTTLCTALAVKYLLAGRLRFVIFLGANAKNAGDILETIDQALAENAELRRYYPEVCAPIAALEHTAQRAGKQLVTGERFDSGEPYEAAPTAFHWAGNDLMFPHVPGSPSAGAVVIAQGLDSALRGLKKRNRRPDLVVIDDPDTDDTINNPDQATKLLRKIDRGIAALGSQRRPVTRIALVTIASKTSVAAQLTDRTVYPSWRGRRFKFLLTPPTNEALWEEFVSICREEWARETEAQDQPPIPDRAHRYYLDRRAPMDEGADVSNPNRHDCRLRADGTTVEVSALEHYYGWVARIGQANTSTEFDNDPPEDLFHQDSGLTPHRIMNQLSGYARYIVPPGCSVITQGVDVKKEGLHYVVKAWAPDATNYVIDYAFHAAHGWRYGTEEGEEIAVRNAILSRMEELRTASPYRTVDGETVPVTLTMVDSGWRTNAVYAACETIGMGIMPAKGCGLSFGCSMRSYHEQRQSTVTYIRGDGWRWARIRPGLKLVEPDTDRWKAFEHARWLTPPGKPGAAYVFGKLTAEEEAFRSHRTPQICKDHHDFAYHICFEMEVEEQQRNGTVKRFWKPKPGRARNHYFDASYLADVAAAIHGIRLPLGAELRAAAVALPPVAVAAAAEPRRTRAAAPAAAGGWFSAQVRR